MNVRQIQNNILKMFSNIFLFHFKKLLNCIVRMLDLFFIQKVENFFIQKIDNYPYRHVLNILKLNYHLTAVNEELWW